MFIHGSNSGCKICFYNMNHIGDIYFSSLFINLICKMNNDITFYYYSIIGDYFFEKIQNIERINKIENNYSNTLMNGNPPEELLDNSILKILLSNRMEREGAKYIQINSEKILFVNTWCKSCFLNHEDFDINSAIFSYINLIKILNSNFNLTLSFKINKPNDLIKYMDNYHLDNGNIDIDGSSIFIFNYCPRSVNFNMYEYNKFILNLSKTNKIILSCYSNVFQDNVNIKFIDKDYNINFLPNCKNLIQLWEIAIKCNKIIIIESGSSWTFLHKINEIKPNQIFMYNNNNNYCQRLNETINVLFNPLIHQTPILSVSSSKELKNYL